MNTINYRLLNELPCELLRKIHEYLSLTARYCSSKKNWEMYMEIRVKNILISNMNLIRYNTFNTYMRYIIRHKLYFVFDKAYELSKEKHKKFKKFIYKGKKWNKYKEFLKWYCRNQGSGKCLNVLLKI
jgi:hypothetical protein|uniref:Uncharacterized protein n=1 Tax=viral metagenome TaxID=1070528 RepID=A0A6C0IQE4_9ZZZZ